MLDAAEPNDAGADGHTPLSELDADAAIDCTPAPPSSVAPMPLDEGAPLTLLQEDETTYRWIACAGESLLQAYIKGHSAPSFKPENRNSPPVASLHR